MRSRKEKISDNYLDYVPVHSEAFKWEQAEDGAVTIFVENKGLFNRIAQKCFHKPAISQVHLDEMGNFIWPLIDGTRSVYEIAEAVEEQFGEKAQPLYPRLIQYIRNLESYEFILVKKQGK